MLLTANGSHGHPFNGQGTESNHSESDHLSGRHKVSFNWEEPLVYAGQMHGRLRGYAVFYGVVGPFWFPPFSLSFWHLAIFCVRAECRKMSICSRVDHPIVGREKGEHAVQSNVFLWTFWLSHYRLNQWFFCLSALKTRSGCMEKTLLFTMCCMHMWQNTANIGFFVRTARRPVFDTKNMVITSASCSQRGKHAEKTYGFGTPRVKNKVGQIFDPHVGGPCCGAMVF